MAPQRSSPTDPWVWSTKNEVRIKLLLGDDAVDEMAREAIRKKYDMKTAEYAKYWDVAPLMIDSLTAYIVQGSKSPIAGVEPFHAIHPNSLLMIFRFKCSTEENARQIAEMIESGEYEIEIAFYFAGFRQTSTSFVSITGDQLKAAASKTTADGENPNAQYIHRDQASKFIGKYTMNIRKLVYSESPEANTQALSDGLEAQFLSLLQQAMQDATMEKLKSDALQQVWSPSDLDPDVLEAEITKMFSYYQSETERHNDSKMYFNGNVEEMKQSAAKGSGSLSGSIGKGFLKIFSLGLSGSGETATTTSSKNHTITDQVMPETDIQKHLSQHAMETEWRGKKLRPKEFKVYKLSDITDHLQIAVISKQLSVDKEQNAIVRIISTMNTPYSIPTNHTPSHLVITGEVRLYSGAKLGLAMWTVLENHYKTLAYNLADAGFIDLWILRYLSMCLFTSSIITLVMCLILTWGLYSTHVFIFISTTMITLVIIAELAISIITFTNKFQTKLTLQEQLPKLVITYRQGNDERASRALDILQVAFRCCGSDGRLSYQNNVPPSCHMYSVGCLTRTMFFLDSCMNVLASILLLFSLIKLLLVIYFYSFLCMYEQYRQKHHKNNSHLINESSHWRNSSSFESSSSDNLPKKILLSSAVTNQDKITNHDNEYIEKRRIVLNEYDSQLPNKRVQNAAMILPPPPPPPLPPPLNNNISAPPYEQQVSRKLSAISEKSERTETDDSEPDLLRTKQYNPKRKAIITAVNQKQKQPPPPPPLPKKLPMIKSRRKIGRDDDNDNDSERSSSEKSFEDQNTNKRNSDTPPSIDTNRKPKITTNKSNGKRPPTLSFSNVFVTSVSQGDITEQSQNDDIKNPLTTSPSTSSSLSDKLLLTDVTIPKPILKKSNQQSSPSSDQDRIPPSYQDQKKFSSIINSKSYVKLTEQHFISNPTKIHMPYKTKNSLLQNIPKPAPRPSLKQSSINKQDESLV
ncbi:unnamed protein product [Rotaria sp. Silwood1]|nr:unnamed protein product [Rotaria sp. Silwood1]